MLNVPYNASAEKLLDFAINQKCEATKCRNLIGNVGNADVVIVYGDISGNCYNCENVVVIDGSIKGNLVNCENVLDTKRTNNKAILRPPVIS